MPPEDTSTTTDAASAAAPSAAAPVTPAELTIVPAVAPETAALAPVAPPAGIPAAATPPVPGAQDAAPLPAPAGDPTALSQVAPAPAVAQDDRNTSKHHDESGRPASAGGTTDDPAVAAATGAPLAAPEAAAQSGVGPAAEPVALGEPTQQQRDALDEQVRQHTSAAEAIPAAIAVDTAVSKAFGASDNGPMSQASLLAASLHIDSRNAERMTQGFVKAPEPHPAFSAPLMATSRPQTNTGGFYGDDNPNEKRTDAIGSRTDATGRAIVGSQALAEPTVFGPGEPVYVGTALDNVPSTGQPAASIVGSQDSPPLTPAMVGWVAPQ